MKRLLPLLLAALLLLSACSGGAESVSDQTFDFYYRAPQDADELLSAETVSVDAAQLSVQELLTRYLRGPKDRHLRRAVPPEWQLESAYLDADTAVLIFSDPESDRPAVEISVARAAIARTLLQLAAIQKVSITISGQENSVTLTQKDILFDDTTLQTQQEEVVLYVPEDSGRYLRRETVLVEAMDVSKRPEYILRQLLLPENNGGVIPPATVLLSVSVENGVCTVDLSSQFVYGMDGGFTATRLAVYAIVNSLTELPEIRTVDLWVSGAPLERLGLLTLSESLRRDETIIRPQDDSELLDVTIYPAVEDGGLLVPIGRLIPDTAETPVAQSLLEALFAFDGSNGIRSFVPTGTKVLSMKIENGVCVADLTREFLDSCKTQLQEQLAVRSVIATLTSLDEIRSVELLVEGIEPVFRNTELNQVGRPLPSWFAE